jgi:hypothetical protein
MSPSSYRQSATSFALLFVLSGLSGLSTFGCAGDLDPALKGGGSGTGGTGAMVCDPTPSLATRCGQGGCHSTDLGSPQAGLDLKSAGVAARLKAAPMPGMNISCTDAQRTAYLGPASNVTSGFLFLKLSSATLPCGSVMPELPGWTATDTTCLTEWATAVVNGTVQ